MKISNDSWIVKYARRHGEYPFEYDEVNNCIVTDSCTLFKSISKNFFKDLLIAVLVVFVTVSVGDALAWIAASIVTMTFIDSISIGIIPIIFTCVFGIYILLWLFVSGIKVLFFSSKDKFSETKFYDIVKAKAKNYCFKIEVIQKD